MGEIKKMDLRVRSVTKVESHKEDVDKEVNKIFMRDEEGVNQVVITMADEPDGISPGMTLTVSIKNEQKTLKEATEEVADETKPKKRGRKSEE